MTEKDKMISGLPYRANDPELIKQRAAVRKILGKYSQVGVHRAVTSKLNCCSGYWAKRAVGVG